MNCQHEQCECRPQGFWTKERNSLSDVIFVFIAFLFVAMPLTLMLPSIVGTLLP